MQKIRNLVTLADAVDSWESRGQWFLVLFSAVLSGCALVLALMYCAQLRDMERAHLLPAAGINHIKVTDTDILRQEILDVDVRI